MSPINTRYFGRSTHSQPPNRGTAVNLKESITLKEIKEGNLSERVVKIIECLSSSIDKKTADDSEQISLSISAFFNPDRYKKGELEEEKAENNEDVMEVVQALEEALKKRLEQVKRISKEVPEKLKKLREGESKIEEKKENCMKSGEKQQNGEPEVNLNKKKLSDETLCKKKNRIERNGNVNEETTVTLESTDNQVESTKKAKKHKRTSSENLNSTATEGVTKTKKQKQVETPNDVTAPSPTEKIEKSKRKRSRKSETIEETVAADDVTEENIQTPTANKKKNKRNSNSVTNVTPSNEKTPDNKNSEINTSLKSSKKKRKNKQVLQESADYLPLAAKA